MKVYATFGGLEDGEGTKDTNILSTAKTLSILEASLKVKDSVIYKNDIYSNLDHMDMQLPTFIKGLRWLSSE